jgi:hypothetical protein
MVYEQSIMERNPWWISARVPEALHGIQRLEYLEKIDERLKDRKILAILGIRRSGKSTLLYQSISHLLDVGINPKKVFYINSDGLKKPTRDNLERALDFCQQKNMVSLKDEKVYVFIDEIQNVKEWQLLLKKFYDLKYASKFIVSGSSSSLIYKDSSESLAGRIGFLDVFPLTFREFLEFNNVILPKVKLDFLSFRDAYYELSLKQNEILGYLAQYITVGGFPEWFEVKNEEMWFKILSEEYTSLLLYRDIVKVFSIRDPLLLESIFKFVAAHSSERFSYLGIARQTNGDKETSKQYLYHLAKSRMIYLSGYYTKSEKAVERKGKKVYFCDIGLKNSFVGRQDIGFDAENIAFLHCIKKVSEELFGKVFYWFDKNKYETDIIMSCASGITPIEVKYGKSFGAKDLKGLVSFCKEFNIKHAFVVSRSMLDERDIEGIHIVIVPLWVFLLS